MNLAHNFPAYAIRGARGKPKVAVRCRYCVNELVGSDAPNCPPARIAKHFRAKGWLVAGDGSSATCPGCQRRGAAQEAQTEASIQADLERQQARATPPAPPEPEPESPLDRCVRLIAQVPSLLGRPHAKAWLGYPGVVAEIVATVLAQEDRQAFLTRIHEVAQVHPSVLQRYLTGRRGTARETIEWTELVQEMRLRGCEPLTPRYTRTPDPEPTEEPQEPSMTRETLRAQAKMFELLREHFDGDGAVGRYAEGWSDDRISKESGLSLPAVREARESVYGRMVDPRVALLTKELADLRERHAGEVSEMRQLLDNMASDGARRIEQLVERVARLEGA